MQHIVYYTRYGQKKEANFHLYNTEDATTDVQVTGERKNSYSLTLKQTEIRNKHPELKKNWRTIDMDAVILTNTWYTVDTQLKMS